MYRDLALLACRVAMDIDFYLRGKRTFEELIRTREFIEWFDSINSAILSRYASEIVVLWQRYRKIRGEFSDNDMAAVFEVIKKEIRNPLFLLVNGEKDAETDRSELEFLRKYMLEISKGFQSEGL